MEHVHSGAVTPATGLAAPTHAADGAAEEAHPPAPSLHLYAVLSAPCQCPPELRGIDGHEVGMVCCGDLAAVVSPGPSEPYQSLSRQNLLRALAAHQAVIEQLLPWHTVLPIKFGTTAHGHEDVERILARAESQLTAALRAIDGKIELDLVAMWRDLTEVLRTIGRAQEIRCQVAGLEGRGEQTVEDRVRVGRLVKSHLERTRNRLAADIVDAVRPLAFDSCAHSRPDDRMIVNSAFLMAKTEQTAFEAAVHRLDDGYGGTVHFRCVGPLPPYSFATVEFRRFALEQIEAARQLLRLGRRAAVQEVRERYRRLAWEHHPDRLESRSGGRFVELAQACRLLTEYCEHGGVEFSRRGVEDTVGVRVCRWPHEPGAPS